jgi:hypothetical protein
MRSIHSVLLLASSTLLLSLVVACSSNDDGAAGPSRPPTPPPANTSQVDGGDGGEGSGTCFDTTKGKPTSQSDFLNQCNGTECFPFDNGVRIEGYTAGAPLPRLN